MTEPATQKRRRDTTAKIKKHVSLTPETVEKIGRFADEQGVSFSAAIESLSLIGLGDDVATAVLPVITSSLYRAVNSSFNRIAKLAAMGAIEAGQTRELTDAMLLQLLANQHARYGDEFEEKARIPKGHPARKLRDKLTGIGRYRAVKRLKSPLAEIDEILHAEEVQDDE